MLSRDRVVDATDAALGERPEAFNRVGVDIPAHVDDFGMINTVVLGIQPSSGRCTTPTRRCRPSRVAAPFDQVRHEPGLLDVRHGYRHDPTATLDHAENRLLVRVRAKASAWRPLAPTADLGFVGLNHAGEHFRVLFHKLVSDQVCQVLDFAAPLVLRDLPHGQHAMRYLRKSARTGAWRYLQDRVAYVRISQ